MNHFKAIFLLAALLLLSTGAFASFDPNFNFSAKISDQQQGTIIVDMRVAPQHMLYRNQLSLRTSTGALKIEWPPVTEKKDPFGEGLVEIYPAGNYQIKVQMIASAPVSSFELTLGYQGCTSLTCFMPSTKTFDLVFNPPLQPVTAPAGLSSAVSPARMPATQTATASDSRNANPASAPINVEMSQDTVDFSAALASKGIYRVLLLAFLGGLLVSLTPCVYPMIPFTLSIIGSRNE
ncbi:MAG: thiol:disulfide interchange protein, partial [uncultured bacterium]